MYLWIVNLLKNWKVLVGIAALGAILALGVWVYSTGAENASLKARTALLEGSVKSLESQLQKERAAARQAQAAAQAARDKATAGRKGLTDALTQDEEAAAWGRTPLPPAVADSLR